MRIFSRKDSDRTDTFGLQYHGRSLSIGGTHIGVYHAGRCGYFYYWLEGLKKQDRQSVFRPFLSLSMPDSCSFPVIPQDPLLFSGTLRSNLDPFGVYDDLRLWDALKRAALVDAPEKSPAISEQGSTRASTPVNRFTLDTAIDDEGANLSVGQRSLVSLARALVKDSRVVLLDEATGALSPIFKLSVGIADGWFEFIASVDYETDSNIQETIKSEFGDRTLLCIAHRIKCVRSSAFFCWKLFTHCFRQDNYWIRSDMCDGCWPGG